MSADLFDARCRALLRRVGLVEHALLVVIDDRRWQRGEIVHGADDLVSTGSTTVDGTVRKVGLVGQGLAAVIRQAGLRCAIVLKAVDR